MKISVDVKKVLQEIDLDTGVTSNFLVFVIGGVEQVVPATEEQLQEAIYEATVQNDVVPERAVRREPPRIGAVGEIPQEESSHFVDELLEEPISDGDNPFAEVNAPVTYEEMAEFHTGGASVIPMNVDLVSDDDTEGVVFEEIMQRGGTNPDAPLSGPQQRQQNIQERHQAGIPQSRKQTIAALRKKAKERPARRLPPHQVDEAGNPKNVPQVEPAQPAMRQQDQEVRLTNGPAPRGFDDDGFEQG